MAQFEQFTDVFLDELFKLALFKKDVCEIICKHLDYNYIPVELKGHKKILQAITRHYTAKGTLPTVGSLTQDNLSEEVYEIIDRLQSMKKLPEKEIVLKSLENYIKRVKFQQLYVKIGDLYNNDSQQEAIETLAQEAPDIHNFSIYKDTSSIQEVFGDFFKRDDDRFITAQDTTKKDFKVPFGIDLIDAITWGGSESGETDCFLGRSGSGKTKYLRWRGISAARRGYKVLHIQGEGSEKDCMLGYDATWTGILKNHLKKGELPDGYQKMLEKVVKDIQRKGGSIQVRAYEQFDQASMRDIRDDVLDYFKRNGCYPDLLIVDYLELFHPGNGRRYSPNTEGEKYKREDSARAFKNICTEFAMRGATASQANDISPNDYNKTDWVMTRHNVAGAKGLIDSFSYFFTWNVSADEYKKNQGRLYCDKIREYMGGQTIRIATDFKYDRFFDRNRTLQLYPEDYKDNKA